MTESLALPRLLVEDVGIDACLAERDGSSILVIRPGQSFGSAVSAVSEVLPNAHPDLVRRIVREALPLAAELEAMAGAPVWTPLNAAPRALRPRAVKPWRTGSVSFAVGALVAVGAALAWQASQAPAPVAGVFSDERFGDFADKMGISCHQLGPLAARCTDDTGRVILAEASVAAAHLTYWFQVGDETTFLTIFSDAELAAAWALEQEDEGVPATAAVSMTEGGIAALVTHGQYVAYGNELGGIDWVTDSLPAPRDAKHPLALGLEDLAALVGHAVPGAGVKAPDPATTKPLSPPPPAVVPEPLPTVPAPLPTAPAIVVPPVPVPEPIAPKPTPTPTATPAPAPEPTAPAADPVQPDSAGEGSSESSRLSPTTPPTSTTSNPGKGNGWQELDKGKDPWGDKWWDIWGRFVDGPPPSNTTPGT